MAFSELETTMLNINPAQALARTVGPAEVRGGQPESESAAVGSSQTSAPALYVNPRLRFDREAAILVIEIRDVQSGEVQRSIPDQSIVNAYRRAALAGEAAPGQIAERRDTAAPEQAAQAEGQGNGTTPSTRAVGTTGGEAATASAAREPVKV